MESCGSSGLERSIKEHINNYPKNSMTKKHQIKLFVSMVFLGGCLSFCTNNTKDKEELEEYTEDQMNIMNSFLSEYSYHNSFVFLDESCSKAFEASLQKASVWPSETIMLEACFYKPKNIINKVVDSDSTSDFFIYFYFKYDTTYAYESYFYSDNKGQFIPVHFRDDYVEVDPYYIVYLPLSNTKCNDMIINSGSIEEDKFNGVFERVDNETHVPIKDR